MHACILCYWLYTPHLLLRENPTVLLCTSVQDLKDARQGETINIFSVASGHL